LRGSPVAQRAPTGRLLLIGTDQVFAARTLTGGKFYVILPVGESTNLAKQLMKLFNIDVLILNRSFRSQWRGFFNALHGMD
jgi:hypothetical protein